MTGARARSAVFYVVMAVGLLLLVTKTQKQFLPGGLATQIGHNSEALLFALLVSAEIQVLRGLRGTARLAFVGVGAVVLVVLGILLLNSDLIPTLVTLNEPLIGSGLVLVYLALPRSPVTGLVSALVVLAVVVVFFDTAVVLDQAESLVPLLLAGPALDVFDRTILQPGRADAPGLRLAWMALLLVVVIALMPAAHWARQDLHGPLRYGIDYAQRAAEAYWGWLLVHLFFSYWLGARWRTAHRTGAARTDRVVVS